MATNLPIKKYRCGNIEAAVWSNKRNRPDGSEIEFKTISISRSYKKKDEDLWRSEVMNLRRNDLQKVILVLQKAQEELLLTSQEKEEGDEND